MKHNNRIAVQNPKKGKSFCGKCDVGFIGEGAKCPVCGWTSETKHGRKRDFIDLMEDCCEKEYGD